MEGAEEPLEKDEGSTESEEMWDLASYPLAERAFDKAKEGLAAGEVPIGCVFAYFPDKVSAEDKPLQPVIIAESYNSPNLTRNPTRHAEINAIEIAMEWADEHNIPQASLWPRTSVIVTVEPCVMCASALLSLGVRHVRFGCHNFRFGGCGSVVDVPGVFGPKPEDAGCSTKESTKFVGGWRGEEAVMLLKEFYKGENPNAPADKARKKRGRKKSAATTESEAN
ncbi:tRNA-specific adenosine deaminase 2 [Ischnura elegans]|uniref:tRNA-specific adenosine deaminase 2 n=1 Tax=Ischnura elegans TaxID=197161 RepID=UPI001ED8BCE9|nr:tRNA-specific adenosine deaminase 2 [Ischnura elegans]